MSTENRSPLKTYTAKPCQEDFANMSPCGENRFCGKCNKTVFDFTSKTPEEIIAIHQEHGGRVCGRYLKSQLTLPPRFGVYSKDSSSPPSPGALAPGSSPWTLVQGFKLPSPRLGLLAPGIKALTVASITCITPAVAQVLPAPPIHQEIPSQDSTPKPVPAITQEPVCPIYKIKGTVSDTHKEPLIGASIVIVGTNKGTVTDFYGNYVLDVSQEMMTDSTINMLVSYTGYASIQIPIQKEDFKNKKFNFDLQVNLQIEEFAMTGEYVVIPRRKRIFYSIKYKLKQLFR